ncbi:MAG: putative pAp phosphatase [Harvfovirus sp.]|uniref:Putative pAp phosphatase n=1 Tax=Harvfovirus sp. TaxID=2487768 RepID=A0A3G5A592_9VIRU|nr:MAG: putative pAp phosphatase [Harvfovirus sp.]
MDLSPSDVSEFSKDENFNYVIFHKNCFDGFSGFVILMRTKHVDPNAIIFPDVPSAKDVPPDIENKHVIIIDVAYKNSVLSEIFRLAKRVVFIDHHISIKNDVIQLITMYNDRHTVVYDDTKSGASLTWDYFYPNKPRPKFISYIEDNDIGAWKLKYTHQFILGLSVNYNLDITDSTLKQWNKLFNIKEVKQLIKLGIKYTEYEKYLLNQNAKRYTIEAFPSELVFSESLMTQESVFIKPGEYRVAVINGSGCPTGSLLGKKIVTEVNCDFCIMWTLHLDKKEIILSFRSNKVDVGQIAKFFGGGGHKFASACSIPLAKYNITDLFFSQSLPRY